LIFNTGWFFLFFLIFYPLFWITPWSKARFFFLLASSMVFHYHFAGPAGIKPIIVMAVLTFGLALWMERFPPGDPRRKRIFLLALAVPVLGLIGYKYRVLFFSTLAPAAGGAFFQALAVQPALPLAISFFTFEFVHYLTDVYHGSQPIRNPFKFTLFCIFFPSIVSGPIKRYQRFMPWVERGIARPGFEMVVKGFSQILLGFFKKLVVADNVTVAIHLVERHTDRSPGAVWLLMLLLWLRILFDFSGYSDIAIGLGKTMGFELPANFNFPYIAQNIADFWNRWHMSLSSWIRDYIYIPLGGSRHGPGRKFANLLLTMFICGLWHGADWHFGFWGVYQGLGLAVHSVWEKSHKNPNPGAIGRWVRIGFTNLFTAYGWLIFFYPLKNVVEYTKTLFFF